MEVCLLLVFYRFVIMIPKMCDSDSFHLTVFIKVVHTQIVMMRSSPFFHGRPQIKLDNLLIML